MHEDQNKKPSFWKKKCKTLGKENHFVVAWRSKSESNTQRKLLYTVVEQDCDPCEDIVTVTAVSENTEAVNQVEEHQSKTQQPFAGPLIENKLVKFWIDCGAMCKLIPVNLLNPDTHLEHRDKVPVMYNKSKLRPVGNCKIKLRNPRNQRLYRLEFQVVDQYCQTPTLGRKASEAMKLIKVQYEDIFSTDSIVTNEDPCDSR